MAFSRSSKSFCVGVSATEIPSFGAIRRAKGKKRQQFALSRSGKCFLKDLESACNLDFYCWSHNIVSDTSMKELILRASYVLVSQFENSVPSFSTPMTL